MEIFLLFLGLVLLLGGIVLMILSMHFWVTEFPEAYWNESGKLSYWQRLWRRNLGALPKGFRFQLLGGILMILGGMMPFLIKWIN